MLQAQHWPCAQQCHSSAPQPPAAAGRKLRRWYGEEERLNSEELAELQGENHPTSQPEPQDDLPRTAILVTDADSPLGEAVVLQLILARWVVPSWLRLASLKKCSAMC